MTLNDAIAMLVDIFTYIAPLSLAWALGIRLYQFMIREMTGGRRKYDL